MAEDSKKPLQDFHNSWLQQPHIHISNIEVVMEKMNCIICGGKEKLQVIFDFDRTLTKHHVNGVLTLSSYGVVETLPAVPKSYKEKLKCCFEKYHPIETDPHITMEEKIPHMVEWWNTGIDILKGVEWDLEVVDEFVKQNEQPFRDGTIQCFEQLSSAKVPVLVFSAGIGDVVKMALRHQNILTPNVHVVSNFLRIKDGKISGYVGDIIHVFNKNEHLIENTPYSEELAGRSNVILLGDSTGDAMMANGIPHNVVLKIGFLNSNIEESLTQYMELFDIVLTDDQTMDVLKHILKLTL